MRRRIALALFATGVIAACDDDGDTPPMLDPRPNTMGNGAMPETCPSPEDDDPFLASARETLEDGREIFRFDTFGDEAFFGDALRLHEAIAGSELGGVGGGLSPVRALDLGLKVDVEMLPEPVVEGLKQGTIDLEDPATTIALLQANAVVGVIGFFEEGTQMAAPGARLRAIGTTCAICHSTVDDSFAPGIGVRRDGWPNRDLNIGAIVALAPTLAPFAELLGVDEETVRQVLMSWGPGKYDAELVLDGRAFQPDGRSAATVLPAAFGLAGVNLATYTGFGSVTYWNAYVANTQMHGMGTFYDPRLDNPDQFPVGARNNLGNIRSPEDLITPKLAALHLYQLALLPPEPPAGSFDAMAAERGRILFNTTAQCATCHVPPLFTEPGWNMHTPEEIGIDDFQASRSPDMRYRTTPLRGLFARMKGGFYHDGRFPTLADVIAHYDRVLELGLDDAERLDLEEYLKSL